MLMRSVRPRSRAVFSRICEAIKKTVTDKFLGDLFDDVAVVHSSTMILERAFDPQTRLLVQPQVVVAPDINHAP